MTIGAAAVKHEDVHEWISEPELRTRLAYSRSTIARLRARGLPHIGRDRLRRYEWAAVLRWLRERG